MSRLIFGYRISNGEVVLNKVEADKIQKFFQAYVSGISINKAAKQAGIKKCHGSLGHMLSNNTYLGTQHYPPIIDKETFDMAQQKRLNRAELLNRVNKEKNEFKILVPTKFHFKAYDIKFQDPLTQAEFIYSMIESEWFTYE